MDQKTQDELFRITRAESFTAALLSNPFWMQATAASIAANMGGLVASEKRRQQAMRAQMDLAADVALVACDALAAALARPPKIEDALELLKGGEGGSERAQ